MYTLLIFFLNRSFLDKIEKNQKPIFFYKLENSSRFCIIILNGAQNFKFNGFIYETLIGWILYTFQDTITRLG